MEKIIEINELSKSYGNIRAVRQLHLSVGKGEMFGLVGPDGAGKTTLIRMLCGILPVDSGGFTVFGMDGIRKKNKIKKRIGYLSQKFSLYGDLTVYENINFFAKVHNVKEFKNEREKLLKKMGIEKFGSRLAERLSGGMKQKLALACTLIHSPEILFLDEPTTGVDPVSRREFRQILAELKNTGITILVTTPYMDEAERCDTVAFMYEGDVLSYDSPDAIKQNFNRSVLEIVCSPIRQVYTFLEKLTDIESIHIFGDRLHVVFDEKILPEEDLRIILKNQNFSVSSIRKVSPSLENIFIMKMEEKGSVKSLIKNLNR